jgi:pimeloyl-ACP methyl ester carboxylesterase
LRGYNDADDAELTDEDWMLHVPVLTIGGAYDVVARPDAMRSTELWARAGYEHRILDGGHWLALENASELSALFIEFGTSST